MHYNCFFFGGFLPFFREALGENAQKTPQNFAQLAQMGKIGKGSQFVNFQEWSDSIYDA